MKKKRNGPTLADYKRSIPNFSRSTGEVLPVRDGAEYELNLLGSVNILRIVGPDGGLADGVNPERKLAIHLHGRAQVALLVEDLLDWLYGRPKDEPVPAEPIPVPKDEPWPLAGRLVTFKPIHGGGPFIRELKPGRKPGRYCAWITPESPDYDPAKPDRKGTPDWCPEKNRPSYELVPS